MEWYMSVTPLRDELQKKPSQRRPGGSDSFMTDPRGVLVPSQKGTLGKFRSILLRTAICMSNYTMEVARSIKLLVVPTVRV
jgi:hypothetical protein